MLIYFGIGLAIAIGLDWFIYETKSSERLTFSEILGCVMFWPLVILGALIKTFK